MEFFMDTIVPWVVLGSLWIFLFSFWAALWHGWTRNDIDDYQIDDYQDGGE
mgnify:CR=1 FL=1